MKLVLSRNDISALKGMGVWGARYGLPVKRWFILPILMIISFLVWGFLPMVGHLSSMNIMRISGYSWVLIPFFVTYGFVCLQRLLPRFLSVPFVWIGGISAAIFATHPIVRAIILPLTTSDNYKLTTMIYLVLCIVIGFVYNIILKAF